MQDVIEATHSFRAVLLKSFQTERLYCFGKSEYMRVNGSRTNGNGFVWIFITRFVDNCFGDTLYRIIDRINENIVRRYQDKLGVSSQQTPLNSAETVSQNGQRSCTDE